MVNTVGSYKNKYEAKKWLSFKKNLSLSSLQKDLILGSMLGDGTMRKGENAKNVNFKIEHGLKQRNYTFWKYNLLKSFVLTPPKISFRYKKENGKLVKYPKSYWFRTVRHQEFTRIYNKFYTKDGYKNGRKIIPKDLVKSLNPFSLAVWIMDDGSYNNKRIDISTYSFTLKEIKFLQNVFLENFGVVSSFYKDRDKGYRIFFNQKETSKIIKTISPYIINSMKYKIGFL